jgi:uncharacterized membrane protein
MSELLAKFALLMSGAWDLLRAGVADSAWSFSPGGRAVLIVGAMLALALVIVCYRRTTEGLTLRSRILLAGSRLVALLVLLVMLSGAICAIDLATDDRPHVLIVLDDSASMTLQNRLADAEAAADALRRRWADDHTINIVRTSVLGNDAASQRPIAQAIVAASAQTPRPPAQIVVISDGVQLGHAPLSAAARETPAPIHTVAAGDAAAVKDIVLDRVWAPSFVFEQDRALVTAEVRAYGLDGEATVQLLQPKAGDRPLAETMVTLKGGDEASLARIEFLAPAAGLERFTLRVVPRDDELTADNNAASFNLDIRPEKVRVLFVEGEPSWEYRHAKQSLESDPAVEFYGLVRFPDQEWFYQGASARPDGKPVIRDPTQGFPSSWDELSFFNVIVLGDLERKQLDQQGRFELIDRFVKSRGGGLLTIGGYRVYAAGNYESTPLARMLPVEMTPGGSGKREKKLQLVNRFNVAITTQGLMHPVMQLEYDPEKNAKAWAEMPWVEGGNALAGVKPGATLLMTHPTLKIRNEPRPIAAAWQYGRGGVLSSALDGTWHWRLARKTESDYHKRYWGLAVRWLAGDPRTNKPFGDLVAENPVLEVGRDATFFLMIRDTDGNPRIDATAEFLIEPPSGEPVRARASSDPRVPGRYSLTIKPLASGEHAVSVAVTTPAGETHEQKRTFYVGESRDELRQPVPDHAAMTDLGKAAGGQSVRLAEAGSLALPASPAVTRAEARVVALWQAPGMYIVLLGALILEWAMRKRRGLS